MKTLHDLRRLVVAACTGLAAIGVAGHVSATGLLTYAEGFEMRFNGWASASASAFCGLGPGNGSSSGDDSGTLWIDLFPSGGGHGWSGFGSGSGSKSCDHGSAEAQADLAATVTGSAGRSSIVIAHGSAGEAFGSAHGDGLGCGGGLDTIFSGFNAVARSAGSVRVPFIVTEHCFATLLVTQFGNGGTADCWWSTTVGSSASGSMSGTGLFYWSGCIGPGVYSVEAGFSSRREASGRATCGDLDVEDGGALSTGFSLNLNFQSFCTCDGDANNDGVVNTSDLLIVINNWGCIVSASTPCPGDVNHDGVVNTSDLLMVINGWGDCPCCLE